MEIFYTLKDARIIIERWRCTTTQFDRPHRSATSRRSQRLYKAGFATRASFSGHHSRSATAGHALTFTRTIYGARPIGARMPISKYGPLAIFIICVLGAGYLAEVFSRPDAWYAGLQKTNYSLPWRGFDRVWIVLYVLIAIAGWRTWHNGLKDPMAIWYVQLVLCLAWPLAFFGLHSMWSGVIIVVLQLVAILLFIGATWRTDKTSATLFLPYAAWVTFATFLNGSILWLNEVAAFFA